MLTYWQELHFRIPLDQCFYYYNVVVISKLLTLKTNSNRNYGKIINQPSLVAQKRNAERPLIRNPILSWVLPRIEIHLLPTTFNNRLTSNLHPHGESHEKRLPEDADAKASWGFYILWRLIFYKYGILGFITYLQRIQ